MALILFLGSRGHRWGLMNIWQNGQQIISDPQWRGTGTVFGPKFFL